MKLKFRSIVLVLLLVGGVLAVGTVSAKEDVWENLNAAAFRFYKESMWPEAIKAAEEALDFAETKFGKRGFKTAISLYRLAGFYYGNGETKKSVPLYERALKIWEKDAGPEHSFVLKVKERLADARRDQGEFKEAGLLYEEVIDSRVNFFVETAT